MNTLCEENVVIMYLHLFVRVHIHTYDVNATAMYMYISRKLATMVVIRLEFEL